MKRRIWDMPTFRFRIVCGMRLVNDVTEGLSQSKMDELAGNATRLNSYQVVEIGNVARLLFGTQMHDGFLGTQTKMKIDARNFPCVILPWRRCWMEWSYPQIGIYRGTKLACVSIDPKFQAQAIMNDVAIRCIDHNFLEEREDQILRGIAAMAAMDITRVKTIAAHVLYAFGYEADFASSPERLSLRSISIAYLNERGEIIEDAHRWWHIEDAPGQNNKDAFNAPEILAAWYATSLMHCKNVLMQDEPVPPKIRTKRERKTGEPMTTYKQLAIKPFDLSIRKEYRAQRIDDRRHVRLHIARGHFKDFRPPNKPLFGKYAGIWWWDQMMRGDQTVGSIDKEYVIK